MKRSRLTECTSKNLEIPYFPVNHSVETTKERNHSFIHPSSKNSAIHRKILSINSPAFVI